MLTVVSKINGREIESNLHIGSMANPNVLQRTMNFIILLQADGHELEKIRKEFSNIRMYNGRVVRWDDAGDIKFILSNLKL